MSTAGQKRKRARDHRRNLNVRERVLLAHLTRYADLIGPETNGMSADEELFQREPTRWLLVPLPVRLLHTLELVGADLADLEEDDPAEDDGISTEPSLGSTNDVDQTNWHYGDSNDHESDGDCDYEQGGDIEDDRPEQWTPIDEPKRPAPELAVRAVKGKPHDHPTLGRYVPL